MVTLRRLTAALVLLAAVLILAAGCTQQKAVDLQRIEGQARGGDQAAIGELVGLLAAEHEALRDRAYAILIDIGTPVVPALLQQLGGAGTVQREYIAAALGNTKAKEAVVPLSEMLGRSGERRRYVAAWALGEIGDLGALPALTAALGDDDPEVRKSAVRALILLGRPAVRALLDTLQSAGPVGEKSAILALGDIADERALPALLQRTEGEARAEVFLALGKLKDPRAEQALIKGLSDSSWQVRMNAAMALGPVGSEACVPALTLAIEDEVLVVREWAARSLEMVTGQRTTFRNEQGEQVAPYNVYH